jgi:hypothetical protein
MVKEVVMHRRALASASLLTDDRGDNEKARFPNCC